MLKLKDISCYMTEVSRQNKVYHIDIDFRFRCENDRSKNFPYWPYPIYNFSKGIMPFKDLIKVALSCHKFL